MGNAEIPSQTGENSRDISERRSLQIGRVDKSLDMADPERVMADNESKIRTSGDEKPTSDPNFSTLQGPKRYILFTAIFLSVLLIALNASIVSTAIPKITSHFNSLEDIGWYGASYLLATCCIQPLTGKLYNFLPIKQTYLAFLVIFCVGSLISSISVSSNMFIIGRTVQGLGGAGIVNGAFTVIAATVPREQKAVFIGVGVGISAVGSVIGPLIGGALTQNVSWRWCFYINLPPSGLVILVLFCLSIPEQMEKKPVKSNIASMLNELDLVGFAVFASACIMLLLAITWGGNQYRWNSPTVIGLLCGGFVTFVIFGIWQLHRGEKAMIPPHILRNRSVVFGCFTSGLQMGALGIFSYYLPLWFQVIKDASPTMSGVMILPTAISQSLGAVVAGKTGRKNPQPTKLSTRCNRLNKECLVQNPGSHRRRNPKTSDVTRLEEKLDGVTAILEASEWVQSLRNLRNPSPFSGNAPFDPEACAKYFIASDSEACAMLDLYHKSMASQFPFITISSTITLAELRQTRPFLNLVIMMAACTHDPERQWSMAEKIKEIMSYTVVIRGEKNLDLLQGIMIYIAWYHLRLGPQITNLVHLMSAMMIDLGLHRDPTQKGNLKLAAGSYRSMGYFVPERQPRPARTLEERRTFLGCFYISSVISICCRDMDSIFYSRYANECCDIIKNTEEYPTDLYLVQLMNIHRLSDKIKRTLHMEELQHAFEPLAPIGACVSLVQSDLLRLKNDLSLEQPLQSLLLLHYYTVEMYLYEIALNDNIDTARYGSHPFARLNMLFASLNSIKCFFDVCYSIPVSQYLHTSFVIWTQIGHALATLSKLSTFISDGWDLGYIRSIIDFSETIDLLSRWIEEAKDFAQQNQNDKLPLRGAPEPFLAFGSKLQIIREFNEKRRGSQPANQDNIDNHTTVYGTSFLSTPDEELCDADALLFQYLDDDFWQQFS